jgi:three-Cys-motif partner protein
MPAGPKDTIWKAEPHTVAKIAILEAYLVAYFQILGRTRPKQKLLCIDGFAGPNQYTNRASGSPTAALNAAATAITNTGTEWLAGKIHFAFVERDKDRYNILLQQLSAQLSTPRIQVHPYNTEFTKALPLIKQAVPEPFQTDSPLFVFLDPFGATGAPFNSVAEILNSPCSEVLINLDADGVSRIFAAKQNANHEEVLTEIFGDMSWRAVMRDDQSFEMQCRKVLQLYKERLWTLPGVKYIFEVEMQGATGTLNYFLVFASKHPLGLMKMKEAMKSIAQNGTYKFADADVGQTALFRFDEPEVYHMKLYEAFKGQKIGYDSRNDEVTAFALNHTPFVDAKAMLRILEGNGMINAISVDSKRKRGTFNNTVSAIDFHGRVQNGVLF